MFCQVIDEGRYFGYDRSKWVVFFVNFDGAVDVSWGEFTYYRVENFTWLLFVDVVNECVYLDFEAVNEIPAYLCELVRVVEDVVKFVGVISFI